MAKADDAKSGTRDAGGKVDAGDGGASAANKAGITDGGRHQTGAERTSELGMAANKPPLSASGLGMQPNKLRQPADVAEDGEEMVTVNVPEQPHKGPLQIRMPDHSLVTLKPGIQEVPAKIADHVYAKASGVVRYNKGAKKDANLPEAGKVGVGDGDVKSPKVDASGAMAAGEDATGIKSGDELDAPSTHSSIARGEGEGVDGNVSLDELDKNSGNDPDLVANAKTQEAISQGATRPATDVRK